MKKNLNSKGFSLVELIVVIAIMAVMAAVLAPALLGYVEKSRMQKDASAMDEVSNAMTLSLADQDIYDELLVIVDSANYSCYADGDASTNTDANKTITKSPDLWLYNDNARLLDETVYKPAGKMRGVTVTFKPNGKSEYILKDGIVNQMGAESTKKGLASLAGKTLAEADFETLYNRLRSTVGDTIKVSSQTYRNSDYTIFVSMGTTGGNQADKQDAIKVYGQYNGTNLPEVAAGVDADSSGAPSGQPGGSSGSGGSTPSTPSTPAYEPLIVGDKVPNGATYYKAPQNSTLDTCDGIQYFCTNDQCFGGWFSYYESCRYCGYEMDYDILTSGMDIPQTPHNGDILFYGDYEYIYNTSGYGPFYDSDKSGWLVNQITTGTKSPGKIVSYINGNPVVSFYCTFETFDGIIPTIPITITDLGMTPDWKIQYEYYYEGTVAQWKSLDSNWWLWIDLDENDNVISEPVVHCKDGDYKASENW